MNYYVYCAFTPTEIYPNLILKPNREKSLIHLWAFFSFLEKMWVFHLAFKNVRKRKTVFRWSVGLVASHLEKYSGACPGATLSIENFVPFANEWFD